VIEGKPEFVNYLPLSMAAIVEHPCRGLAWKDALRLLRWPIFF
jgi:hypothetical protein